MLISAHVLVGTALGRALSARLDSGRHDTTRLLGRDLALAAATGFLSHLACDALPHWGQVREGGTTRDVEFLRIAVPDGLAGLALIAGAVLPENMPRKAIVAATTFGACLPDTDKIGEFAFGRSPWPGWFDAFHGRIQREYPFLLRTDVATIAVFAWLLLLKGRSRRR